LEGSTIVSAPFKTLSGVAVAVADVFVSPKNVARDLGQRPIGLALKLEAIVGDADRVGSPVPFPNEARAGFDPGP